ncbi:MAG: hypothetical protein CVT49_01635 [candidate division Zixibacteria bacterium HGW-Zixibacteria-1]|nr:MAG: hypothetical protein CVT49_01635 [candidate division Zixibacteria bacterium HGW-Zixibacteria-1]
MNMENLSRYKYKSLVITGLGTLMGTLDASIVNVSLPTISRELNTTVSMVAWVVLAYSIAVFPLLMVFGAVSEKKGFQFSYRYGYLIFMTGSILCGLSVNIYMLIISRVIQGVGAALLVAVGPALVTRSFPDAERGRGLSIIAMVVSVGLMLGPPLGGFIIGLAGWRWIFFVNIPVSILGFYFTVKFLGDFPISNPHKKIGVPGAASLLLGMLTLMLTLLLYSRGQLGTALSAGLLLVSGLLFAMFFYFENNPATRLIGIEIFKNRVFVFSGAAMLMVFIALISVTILMPFYLEEVKLYQPEQVGFFLMITSVCGFMLAPLAGYLSDRIQARVISTAGAAIMFIGFLFIRRLDGQTSMWGIALPLAIIGVGMAIFGTPNTSGIMGSVAKHQLGSASGMIATLRTLGIALGAGFSGQDAFLSAYQSVYNITIFILLAAIVFSLVRGRNSSAARGH